MKKIRFLASTLSICLFSIMFSLTAFAEETVNVSAEQSVSETEAEAAASGLSGLLPYIIMIGVFGIFAYFLIIRPDKKRRKEANELRSGLKVGDNVTTIGGIIGTVTAVTDDTFTLNNGLKLKKSAILSIDDRDVDDDDGYDDDDEDDETDDKA